ncbi:hypothetical protein SGRA_2532 [Saprospira grandis str. Lewin]|uniref:Uncharacterized protein n=1 Tax=Saprospira grandis (strain Lewin) TaxID=984262 RepID=H6L6L4_SAPGL|nr:hypothetical protein SGRA_2532 [Saprospira grandis str. Lewin]
METGRFFMGQRYKRKTCIWPSDVQQCGAAADQGRQAAGPSE